MRSSKTVGWALAATAALAFLLRMLGFETVFTGEGRVIFTLGDPYYHLRRALFSFDHFPRILERDPYLNFPNGAVVPWPPLYDFLVAATARLLGDSPAILERVAAWWPPALGVLTVAAVYLGARSLGSPAQAVGAGVLLAVLPASTFISKVGYADHHAAVVLLGALLLAVQLEVVRCEPRAPLRWLALALGLALARAALLLTWSGSLAYVGISEVALVATAAGLGRRRVLSLDATSLVATACLVAPLALRAPFALGGPFTAVGLSCLHPLACLLGAAWALGLWAWAGRSRGGSAISRLAVAAALGTVALLLLVAVPAVREGLRPAVAFVGTADVVGPANPEQAPLFQERVSAERLFGYLAYLVPIAPLGLLALARTATATGPLFVLAIWTAAFGALALVQIRFAADLAPAASIAFAHLLASAGAALRESTWVGRRAPQALPALLLGVFALAPPLASVHAPTLARTVRFMTGQGPEEDRSLRTVHGSLVRFAEVVRQVTPETSGFLDPEREPEYGILCNPNLGHVLHYVARRPTPADNFGPYIGKENLLATLRVLLGPSERFAWQTARRLRVRYLVTDEMPFERPGTLLSHLHVHDGLAHSGLPALSRLRLVAEGPAGGLPLFVARGRQLEPDAVPYKLFEFVEGALLEVRGQPGARVRASVTLVTPTPRRFVYGRSALVDETGWARLRVPYATEATRPVRALGPYRVVTAGTVHRVHVTERDVREGARLVVPSG